MSSRTAPAGPTVLITGASSGIGRATAILLSDKGFRVFAGVRRKTDGEALREGTSGDLTPVLLDVTNENSIAEALEQVTAAVAPAGLAGLVNNAGIGYTGPVETVPIDDLRHQYEVNVFGQVAVIQSFLPLLRAGTGRLLNVGSIGDRFGLPFGAPLASSKAALASITDSLRVELRPWGIQVVLIEPGSIKSDAPAKAAADAERVLDHLTDTLRVHYGDAYRSMINNFLAMEAKGSPPEAAAHVIARALTEPHPRTRYLVGKDSRRLAAAARWLPDRVFDLIKLRVFGLPRNFGGDLASPGPQGQSSTSVPSAERSPSR